MELFVSDVRHAVRSLAHRPGFTLVAVLTLALGIGANTAIFSAVHALLLRPLPYTDPEQLAWVTNVIQEMDAEIVPAADYLEWRDSSHTLAEIAAYTTSNFTLTGREQAERVIGARVSAGFLPLLGIRPVHGRGFRPEEERLNGGRAAVVGERLWERLFGAGTALAEQTITLDSDSYTVVGILPQMFRFPGNGDVDLLLPLALDEAVERGRRQMSIVQAIGRLRPGATLEQARVELAAIRERSEQEARRAEAAAPPPGLPSGSGIQIRRMAAPPGGGPGGGRGPGAGGPRPGLPPSQTKVVPLRDQLVGDVRPALLMMLSAVGLVLLIACANVANLLLARATARQREIAVRAALGADRWRIVRHLLTESTVLGLAGGVCGLLVALLGVRLLKAAIPADLGGGVFLQTPIGVDGPVLLFTLALGLATGLLFGVAPALAAARPDLHDPLKEVSRGGSTRTRRLLVAGEVALAVVLLIGAGLLLRSFMRLLAVDPGFRPERVLTLALDLDPRRYAAPDSRISLFEELTRRVRALPGVQAAAFGDSLPLTGRMMMIARGLRAEGVPERPPEEQPQVTINAVGADYFRTLGIRVLHGRAINERDSARTQPVGVVNQTMARQLWGREDVVGGRLMGGLFQSGGITIVGVVADARHEGLESEPKARLYRPFTQESRPFGLLAVRTAQDPLSLAAAVRREAQAVDPSVAISDVSTMERRLADSVAERRFSLILLGLFALLALVLAGVGLYGVLAYAVTERTREIGVRMALGAERRGVLSLVIRQGLTMAVIGVAVGLVSAFACSRVLASALYGIPATDLATYLLIPMLLMVVALFASYVPARRATRVEPIVALRAE
ncbi:MAG TPA: ABC transporter permease [Thermoanaerobaculia bacterium]|nr:ABC transporter permease [Thermoanaerobaculia bacterium]